VRRARPKPAWIAPYATTPLVGQARRQAYGRVYVGCMILGYESEKGKARVQVRCEFCRTVQWVYVWSWSGNGKRCTGCHYFLERRPAGKPEAKGEAPSPPGGATG
jgi:hypothetical protein